MTYKRRSAGRDRSNPLAPINRATNLPDSEYHGNFNGGYYDREDGKRSTRDGGELTVLCRGCLLLIGMVPFN